MVESSMKPLVTLMIPCYNQAGIVHKAIESALSQDYENLEVLVVDDNSPDNTEEMVKKYQADKRFRFIKNPKNLGRVGNYKKIIYEYARGEWVLNIDGDDHLLDSSYIRKAMDLALANPGVVLVFARMRWLDDKTQTYHDSSGAYFDPVMDGNEMLMRYWKIPEGISNLTALYKRQLAVDRKTHLFDHMFDDAEAFFRMIASHKVGFINTVAGCWIQHQTNYSGSRDLEKRFKTFTMIEEPYKFYVESKVLSLEDANKWRSHMLSRLMREHMSFFMDESGRKDAFKFFKMCWQRFEFVVCARAILSPRTLARLISPELYKYLRQTQREVAK